MSKCVNRWWSSVGRKMLMAVTGLALFLFVAVHLIGNLTLLMGPEAFNGYAEFLEELGHGAFIYVAEAGLLVFFLLHAYSGVTVWWRKRKARDTGYEVTANAGGVSRKTWSSRTMIITGPILLLFVILHLIQFKFGPGESAGYTMELNGKVVRDLYRLVVAEFNEPLDVAFYVVVMVLLGFHLRHGFWSALQSLGLTNSKYLPALVTLSLVFGLILAFGFIYIPLHVFFFIEPQGAAETVAAARSAMGGL